MGCDHRVLFTKIQNEEVFMEIKSAQNDVQTVFLRGTVGQVISGLIWLSSAALGTWVSERYAILMLVLVGIFIFPLTSLTLQLLGHPSGLPKKHPFNNLAMQVAFIVPLNLPVIAAAALYNINWFYPAFMLIVGTHYMPFIFLYGMSEFAFLSGALIGAGVAIGMFLPHTFAIGGWITGTILLLFALFVQIMPRLAKK
jgi:hypothetical protein